MSHRHLEGDGDFSLAFKSHHVFNGEKRPKEDPGYLGGVGRGCLGWGRLFLNGNPGKFLIFWLCLELAIAVPNLL